MARAWRRTLHGPPRRPAASPHATFPRRLRLHLFSRLKASRRCARPWAAVASLAQTWALGQRGAAAAMLRRKRKRPQRLGRIADILPLRAGAGAKGHGPLSRPLQRLLQLCVWDLSRAHAGRNSMNFNTSTLNRPRLSKLHPEPCTVKLKL